MFLLVSEEIVLNQESHNLRKWKLFYLPRALQQKEFVVFVLLVAIGCWAVLGIIQEINKLFGVPVPTHGGSLIEGVVGNPRFINPLLAQNDVDRDLVALTFSGLFRHDGNGNVVPVLAEKNTISDDGLMYTVTLKKNLKWSDGEPITSADVAFTVQLAKSPQIQSPRRANWEGIETEIVDQHTIRFRLPKPYSPFIENLTMGIIPEHKWKNIPLLQLTVAEMNMKPIGAGPYVVRSTAQNSEGLTTTLTLSANKHFALGKPFITNLELKFFRSPTDLMRNLQNNTIDAAAFDSVLLNSFQELLFLGNTEKTIHEIGWQRIYAVFFNQSAKKFFANATIRTALFEAIDQKTLLQEILGNYGSAIYGPLPPAVFATTTKEYIAFNPERAQKTIKKSKEPISFTLTTASATPALIRTAELLKSMWSAVGVAVEIKTFDRDSLEQSVIGPRHYEAFLFGEEIVGKNPDLFAFWHSSQRKPQGLNIALYANSKVDDLLEKVRTEQNIAKQRELHYAIHQEITKDVPALFLYSPHYLYVLPNKVKGVAISSINTAPERFETMHEWYLKEKYVWGVFQKE